ncbi:alpha/beta fold hydrolase [Pseudoduganella sp. FT93W]|uniref:Alpha/beta fold hydrolase n=1 Tax=Duganella fentianensis TaxID=2692177 RepID=A0A845I2Y2_9BURK|nr:alpha/beta hydrolase [Duganella fentianensis]MYN47663.1 alpha/beta fold hydrolase [Duganella fentianensis]
MRYLATTVLALGLSVPAFAVEPVKNIVLVHGQFADASGWRAVYDILSKDGYNVSMVQHPMTSLEEDVAATTRVLQALQGPAILVGHSYGGAVITQAGNAPQVAGLVYIAAHAPDAGESTAINKNKLPGQIRTQTTPDGYVFVQAAHFQEDFAADLPKADAEFMARSQMPPNARVNTTLITNPAWRNKPSWYMVAKDDRAINPELERMYAARAKATTVEVSGSHAIYISRAREVAAMIEEAATKLGK